MNKMGSSRLWGKITVLVAVCGWGLSAQAKYSGGSGTEAEPFRISAVSDWQELMATPADWASHFVLTSDIDLNGVSITPIAPDTNTRSGFQGTKFTGVFDGNGYVIRNADVNMPGSDYVGLFGYLRWRGQIKNLGIEDASIFGKSYVGGLVGYNYDGPITNSYLTGSVSGADYVGGVVGLNGSGAISNCYLTGSVSGTDYVGGVVGLNGSGAISNCYAIGNCYSSGTASGTGAYVGGLVGGNSGTISDSYSGSSVGGEQHHVGGLVGHNAYGTISDSCSDGSVRGTDLAVGGLVGGNWSGVVANCYSNGSVSGNSVGGLVGLNVDNSDIRNCYSTASVRGTEGVGGLVAFNDATISNSYSSGPVQGTDSVGGLLGWNNEGSITNCYSRSYVTGTGLVGGLVGQNFSGVIKECYSAGPVSSIGSPAGGMVGYANKGDVSRSFWDVNTSGWATSASGIPKTTAQMKDPNTFVSAGWDFVGEAANGTEDIWAICEGTNYPRLVWQIPQGDIVCPDGVNGFDYSLLARYWHETDCTALNDCEGADIDLSGAVDFGDVAAVAESWLRGVE